MADLILKFFREEMTQAEEKALSDALLSSTEDALRFGEQAEKAYLGFGLPEPQWPGGAPPSAPWSHGSLGFKALMWVGAALTAGLAGLLLWQHREVNQPIPAASIAPLLPAPLKVEVRSKVKTKQISAAPFIIAKPVPAARWTPVLTPVEVTALPRKIFSNLSVVVRRSSPGNVTVRVFNPDETLAVLLYEGPLQAGKWIFDWDGKLANGEPAPPGYYRIQVESGPVVQNKNILVR